jgi:hypothetical protein
VAIFNRPQSAKTCFQSDVEQEHAQHTARTMTPGHFLVVGDIFACGEWHVEVQRVTKLPAELASSQHPHYDSPASCVVASRSLRLSNLLSACTFPCRRHAKWQPGQWKSGATSTKSPSSSTIYR